ncbi:MAG: hypothetical protein HYR80_01330 [Nitrospirae bacterium]|nr:hypothetical protein [Nitrospirota bacterium]
MVEIIEAIKSLRGLDSDLAVSRLLGIRPQTLTVAKSRGSIPYRDLIDMSARENISLEWLFHGTGPSDKGFSPEKKIDQIKKSGILETKELSFIINEIQRSYHASMIRKENQDVISKEVVNLGEAFVLVLKTISFKNKKKRLSDFMFFFYLDWPSGELSKTSDIKQFIEVAEPFLSDIGRTKKVPCHVAGKIASCFSVLVQHPLNFSLPEETFVAIRKLLEPWCFDVANPVGDLGNKSQTTHD